MRKVFFLLLALSAVAGAPIAGTAAETQKAAGQAISVAGPVVVLRPDVVPHPLTFRDNLYWRDVVEARKDGIARVLLGGKATVTVRELSRLELREERRTEGVRYVVDLVRGKVRASVARMLMRPGEQVEVWTFNTVASVRGTDFIVETLERPTQAGTFGLLGVRQVADAVGDGAAARETVVVTLSGLVDVVNPLAGTGRTEQVGAYEAVRVSGRQDPVRLQVSADEMKVYLRRLTPPRPQQPGAGIRLRRSATRLSRRRWRPRNGTAGCSSSVVTMAARGGAGGTARAEVRAQRAAVAAETTAPVREAAPVLALRVGRATAWPWGRGATRAAEQVSARDSPSATPTSLTTSVKVRARSKSHRERQRSAAPSAC
ncbi:MAG: FecR domain-containing protein [Candidatus Rokubacteria bacterium]|nr:FecR domain-containing protein [Candidatus Rokubacteria bacterium]